MKVCLILLDWTSPPSCGHLTSDHGGGEGRSGEVARELGGERKIQTWYPGLEIVKEKKHPGDGSNRQGGRPRGEGTKSRKSALVIEAAQVG